MGRTRPLDLWVTAPKEIFPKPSTILTIHPLIAEKCICRTFVCHEENFITLYFLAFIFSLLIIVLDETGLMWLKRQNFLIVMLYAQHLWLFRSENSCIRSVIMRNKIKKCEIHVPEDILTQWQSIVDLMAELAGIPAGLIMRIVQEEIEVFLASSTEGNPYHSGDREHLVGSGLYCETVITTKKPLLVSDALADPEWKNNPDIKLNMVSYLGFPILLPDSTPFGTICILDNKANKYSGTIHQLMLKFRDLVESHLGLLYMNTLLGERNRCLSDYLDELQSLRGLIPICARCKKIKDSEGYWNCVEKYLIKHPHADFTHSYCPDCAKTILAELKKS